MASRSFFLIGVGLCWVGVYITWSFEYSLAVPFFSANLHLSTVIANLIWIAGPVSGLIVGPIVGVLSDRSTATCGRRRVFIGVGLISTCSSALGFALSEHIFGPASAAAAYWAVTMFWIMDFSINTIQTPLRALVSDIAEEKEQVLAQSVSASLAGCGQMLGFLIVTAVPSPLGHLVGIYMLGTCCLVGTTLVTMCLAEERKPDESVEPPGNERHSVLHSVGSIFADICNTLRGLSAAQRVVCGVQALTWAAWFCHQQVVTDMFGTVVMRGDKGAPAHSVARERYSTGLHAGSLALTLQQLTSLLASAAFGLLEDRFGTKQLYGFSLAVVCFCMLVEFVACQAHEPPVALVQAAVALTGIGYGGTQIFPYSIMGMLVPSPRAKGLAMGTLSMCIVTPQMLDMTYVGIIGEAADMSYVVLLGAIYAGLASALTRFLVLPEAAGQAHPRPEVALLD